MVHLFSLCFMHVLRYHTLYTHGITSVILSKLGLGNCSLKETILRFCCCWRERDVTFLWIDLHPVATFYYPPSFGDIWVEIFGDIWNIWWYLKYLRYGWNIWWYWSNFRKIFVEIFFTLDPNIANTTELKKQIKTVSNRANQAL